VVHCCVFSNKVAVNVIDCVAAAVDSMVSAILTKLEKLASAAWHSMSPCSVSMAVTA